MAVFGAIHADQRHQSGGFVIRPYYHETRISGSGMRSGIFCRTVGRLAAIIAALTVLAVGVPDSRNSGSL